MANRKRISSADLSWRFFEAMRGDEAFHLGMSVAVVPDPKLGWRAVIAGRNRKMSTAAQKRLETIEKRLRARFALSDD